jgi:diguanylate cyclase (GGDEF)-like protein
MYHGLFFGFDSHLASNGDALFAVYEREALWWVFFLLSHVVAGASLLCLLYAVLATDAYQKPVLLALLFAVTLPLFFNLAYIFFDLRVMSFNFSPFSFLLSYVLLVGIVYLARAFDIEAIGADMVFYRSRHPVLVVDQSLRLYSANPAFRKLAAFHGFAADELTCNLVAHLANQPQDGSFELGNEHYLVTHIEIRASVPLGNRRAVVGHAYQLIDMTDQKRLEQKFRTLAETDTLTQVSSRGFFMDSLEAAKGVTDLGVFIVDMDFFKRLNDQYGHDLGDAVLREVGSALLSISGGRQTAGRIGGEEFILYQQLQTIPEMEAFAERICSAIRKIDISVDGTPIPLTASVGATILHKGGDVSAALRRADSALYAVKAQGRDGYRINTAATDTNTVQVGPSPSRSRH